MSSPSDRMTFLNLDVLSNYLIEETKDFELEFGIKSEYIQEQDKECVKNQKDIIFIDQFVESMNKCVLQTELELKEFESTLLQAVNLLSRCEATQNNISQSTQSFHVVVSSYMDLLKRLLSADRSVEQCNILRTEIDQYNNEVSNYMRTPKLISEITDCHVKALYEMEQQVNQLESMVDEVDEIYAQMTAKIGKGSLYPTCDCEMAKAILTDKSRINDCLQRKFNRLNKDYKEK